MSTRCMVMLEKNETCWPEGNRNNGPHFAAFYRHHDGYPTVTGFDLVKKVSQVLPRGGFDTCREAVRALQDVMPLGDYENEWHEQLHGDIEYMYLVNFDHGCVITAHKRPIGTGNEVERWREWPAFVLARWEPFYRDGRKLGLVLDEIHIRRSFESSAA